MLFTNYQFYIDEFIAFGKKMVTDDNSGYTSFVEPGNCVTSADGAVAGCAAERLPQMPAYHMTRPDKSGITMINIGVGPSNAKTITDHVAVLRPHTWLMLGHCAGLRNSQELGDYVLAHAYVREDHVLDDDLPVWIPLPALAEVQVALEQAVADVTGYSGYELEAGDAHGHRGDDRQSQLGTARPARPGAAAFAIAGDRARHGIGNDRPLTASASGCPMARFYAFPTSRCMAN